jgi:hypothetical protein
VYYGGDLVCCAQTRAKTKDQDCESKNLVHHTVHHECEQMIYVYVDVGLERVLAAAEHVCLLILSVGMRGTYAYNKTQEKKQGSNTQTL